MSNFGERLRQERKRLGLTQDELAEQGGVKKGAQFNYENGVRNPDVDYLLAIAAIGVDTQYLLHGEPSKTNLSDDETELLFGYRNLDIRGKAGVLGMVETLGTAPSDAVREKQERLVNKNIGKKTQIIQGSNISAGKTTIKLDRKKKDAL